jgi:MYXO-CTERM domain-containing protein
MALWHRGGHRGHPRYVGGLVTLAVTAAVAPGAPTALAQSSIPDDNAGTGQYVEPVPDAGGDRPSAPGHGARGGLPPATQRALPGGAEGRQLERLATDPGSGSPGTDARDRSRGHDGKAANRSGSKAHDETPLSSVASAATGDDGPGVPIVFLTIGLLTLGAVAVAVRRRRRGGQG